jgi:hypothetical protein
MQPRGVKPQGDGEQAQTPCCHHPRSSREDLHVSDLPRSHVHEKGGPQELQIVELPVVRRSALNDTVRRVGVRNNPTQANGWLEWATNFLAGRGSWIIWTKNIPNKLALVGSSVCSGGLLFR